MFYIVLKADPYVAVISWGRCIYIQGISHASFSKDAIYLNDASTIIILNAI